MVALARKWRLPDSLRSMLGGVHGRLIGPDDVDRGMLTVSVGDVCSRALLDAGVRPDLVVVDFATKRGPYQFHVPEGYDQVRVRNPPGYVTESLRTALGSAILSAKKHVRTLIRVDGEEDLAVPPLLPLLPDGSQVIYGVPDSGMAMLVVDASLKVRALEILAAMVEETD